MSYSTRLFLLSIAAVLCIGCSTAPTFSRQPIPYVTEILQSPHGHDYGLVNDYDPYSSHGTIAVIGEPDRVLPLSEFLLKADFFDNVDGSQVADHLPDFAGERVASLCDSAAFPYYPYFAAGDVSLLRQQSVLCALASLDSICQAKVIVLADPYLTAYGLFDIDTLFSAVGSAIPVESPAMAALDYAKEKSLENIAILVDSLDAEYPIYRSLLDEYGDAPECRWFFTRDKSPVRDMIIQYVADGNREPLQAIMIEGTSYEVAKVRADLESLMNSKKEADNTYKTFLSPDCQVIDPMEIVSGRIYRLMRERNIFTHNVAYPQHEINYTVYDRESGKTTVKKK